MGLCGTTEEHCCWMDGVMCGYVMPSPDPLFRWRCALRSKYGSWYATHTSPEYLEEVQPRLRAAGIEQECGDWPLAGVTCHSCGEVGK